MKDCKKCQQIDANKQLEELLLKVIDLMQIEIRKSFWQIVKDIEILRKQQKEEKN